MSGFLAPIGFGDPRVAAIPQPWDTQPYSPYEYRPGFDEPISIDPGMYALPQPGWYGDPGMVIPQDQHWAGDPGIYAPAPNTQPQWQEHDIAARPPIERDAVAALSVGDHIKHGAEAMVVPALLGGALTGVLAASTAPAGLKGANFVARGFGSTMAGIGAGAGMGLLVGATSPRDGDSLQTRYAVAGGLIGAASGATFSTPATRGASIAVGSLLNGAMGWFIGRHLEHEAAAERQAAAAPRAAPAGGALQA